MKRDFLRGFLFAFFVVFVVGCSERDYHPTVEETPSRRDRIIAIIRRYE
jgi:hypothetical protein